MFILKRFAALLPAVDVVYHDFIETQFPRSSSGFCEKFAGNGGSDPGQTEDSRSAHIVDSASCFLDLNSNGDVVIHALADLDLNSSIELLGSGGHSDDNQHSMISCDTDELLRTPSPCLVESDHEAEPFEAGNTGAGVEASNPSSGEQLQKGQVEKDQSATMSTIHKENSQGFCIQVNDGIQSTADIPATSTPKKQKVNGHSNNTQILEGRYIRNAYCRDGTRVGWYRYTSVSLSQKKGLFFVKHEDSNLHLLFPDLQCDVHRTDLLDGSSLYCVWMSRPGQQGTLLQTDRSLHNQSGASLGEVSQDLK